MGGFRKPGVPLMVLGLGPLLSIRHPETVAVTVRPLGADESPGPLFPVSVTSVFTASITSRAVPGSGSRSIPPPGAVYLVRHLVTENVRSQLVERGIQPSAARKAAMFQLAAEIPTPIRADILTRAPKTPSGGPPWPRDWSRYTAMRRQDGSEIPAPRGSR